MGLVIGVTVAIVSRERRLISQRREGLSDGNRRGRVCLAFEDNWLGIIWVIRPNLDGEDLHSAIHTVKRIRGSTWSVGVVADSDARGMKAKCEAKEENAKEFIDQQCCQGRGEVCGVRSPEDRF